MKKHTITFTELLPYAEKTSRAYETLQQLFGFKREWMRMAHITDYQVYVVWIEPSAANKENPQPKAATGLQM